MTGMARRHIPLVKAAACCAAICAAGCCQKDLYFPADDTVAIVDVEFDWSHAENAAVEGMSTFFFPLSQGGKIWNFEIAGMEGGTVALAPGDYAMVAVNNDLPGVDLSVGDDASSVKVNTRLNADGTLRPSGMVYGAVTDVNIPGEADDQGATRHVVSATPDSLATVYNVILRDVSQAELISSIQARLSGVAVSLDIKDNARGSGSGTVSIPIDLAAMSGSTTALGTPSGTPQFTLTLYAELKDSRRTARSLTYDITPQVTEAPHRHNVYVILSGLSFDTEEPEQPGEGEGVGMDVGVDGWSSITIDLITGS